MQIPIRKAGKRSRATVDPHLTTEKISQLKLKLERLLISRPRAASEVKRLAELGDFSENAAYSMAKGRLRRINDEILETENTLKRAVVIKAPQSTKTIQLGHRVTVSLGGVEKTFWLLGSAETNPSAGIISSSSPLGAAIMGLGVGDNFKISGLKGETHGRIISIS